MPRMATKKITIGAGAGSLPKHRHPYGRRKTDWLVATKFLLPRLLGVLGVVGLRILFDQRVDVDSYRPTNLPTY